MSNLSNDSLGSLPIIMPDSEQQGAILAELDAVARETRALESTYREKKGGLGDLKQSLLAKAFAGELT